MSSNSDSKKEPLPTKETASSNTSLQKRRLSARDRQAVKSLQRKMGNRYNGIFPTWLLSSQYHKDIGSAIWLLLVIIRACDWNSGQLKTTKRALGYWLGVDIKTIKNHLLLLETLDVRHERGYGSDLYIFLPDKLTPGKVFPRRPVNNLPLSKKNNSLERESVAEDSGNNFLPLQTAGDIAKRRYERLRESSR